MSKRAKEGRPGSARSVLNPDETDPLLRFEYDRGSHYEIDTRVTLAMAALVPEAELHNADHRMFQVVHLVTEYAWCAMHHELRRVCGALDADDFTLASRLLGRAIALGDLPVDCVRLLQNFLPQVSMLWMRDLFPANTSGLDSPGGRNLRKVCRVVWKKYGQTAERHGLNQQDLIDHHARQSGNASTPAAAGLSLIHNDLHLLDCKIMEWRQLHLRLVRSHLGGHPAAQAAGFAPTSLRGESTGELERMTEQSLFPVLWKNVDEIYRRTTPSAPCSNPIGGS